MGGASESSPLLGSPGGPPVQPAWAPQLLAALCGGLIAMVVGSTVSLPSALIPQLVEDGLARDLAEASVLATAYLYTAVPACLAGGLLSDWIGRRLTVLLSCPVLLAGYLAVPLAPSLSWLVPARLLSALGAWLAYPSANILVTEFVHPSVRGSLGSFTSLFLAVGMLQSYLLGYLLPWRSLCWVLVFQPPLLFLCLLLLPESPQWLALQGRRREAAASLAWARGKDWDCGPELEELLSRERPPGVREKLATLASRPFLRSLAISGGLFFLCQYTGISTLVVFMEPVFADSGLSLSPRLAPVIIGMVRVVTSCCSSAVLRRANRKYMFSSCSLLLSLCCAAMAAFSHWRLDLLALSPSLGVLPLVIAILMFVSHAFGINAVMHLITGEMFPGAARSLGSSLTLAIAIMGNGLNASLYPVVLHLTSFSCVFAIYAVATLAMFVLAVRVIPDHRGLSLVTIERREEGGRE